MNNYHLFLIRSDQVTQICAHLAAGIVTLLLIASIGSPKSEQLARIPTPTPVVAIQGALPAGTELVAAHE